MRLPTGRARQRLIAGVVGGLIGAWMTLSLRQMRFGIEAGLRHTGFDTFGLILALAGGLVCAVAAMTLVPGRNPWRF